MFRFASFVGAALLLAAPAITSTPAGAIPVVDPDTIRDGESDATKVAFLRRRGNLCYYRHGAHGPGYYPCRVGRRFLHPRLFVHGLRHRDRFEHARRDRGRVVRGTGAPRVGVSRDRFERRGGQRFGVGGGGARPGRVGGVNRTFAPAVVAPSAGVGGAGARINAAPAAGGRAGFGGPGGGRAGFGNGGPGVGGAGIGAGGRGAGAGIGAGGRAGGGGIGGGGGVGGGGARGGGGIGGGIGGGGGHR